MKLIIDRDVLSVALSRVAPIVSRNSPIPILCCVKLAARDGGLMVSGQNNLAVASQSCVAAVSTVGELCVAADKLSALVGTLAKGSQIEIEQTSETRLMIRYSGGRVVFPAIDARDYPVMEFHPEGEPFTIAAEELRRLFGMTLPFVSNEQTRPYLNGACLHSAVIGELNYLRAVATDGSAMAIASADLDSGADLPRRILPTEALSAVSRILNGAAGDVTVSASPHGCRFAIGLCTFTTRLIDGEFPDYRRVLPPPVPEPIIVSAITLKEVTERAQAITEAADATKARPRSIQLSAISGQLQCLAGSDAETALDETIECEGGAGDIILGTSYLIDAITALGGEGMIQLHIKDAQSPVLVRRDRENDPESITLMPRRG